MFKVRQAFIGHRRRKQRCIYYTAVLTQGPVYTGAVISLQGLGVVMA